MTIDLEPVREHAGHDIAVYITDGWRFAPDRRFWMHEHLRAARDPATRAAMRDVQMILMRDGDQRENYRQACERLRAALVRHVIRTAAPPAT